MSAPGRDDRCISVDYYASLRVLLGRSVAVSSVQGVGHSAHLEAPQLVHDTLLEFFGS